MSRLDGAAEADDEVAAAPSPMDVESDDMCWICLDESGDMDKEPLVSPCSCPRKVHPKCLARWQLQQAGRPEETNCRFCHSNLADWKASLTPENLKPEVQRVQPIMVVYFEGEIHRIPVKQGSDGLKEFTNRIRELFRLPEDVDISLTFGCKEPMSGQHLKLEGIGAFDAAVHCASVAAAERQQKLKSTTGSPAGSSGGAADGGGSASPPPDGSADVPGGDAAGAPAGVGERCVRSAGGLQASGGGEASSSAAAMLQHASSAPFMGAAPPSQAAAVPLMTALLGPGGLEHHQQQQRLRQQQQHLHQPQPQHMGGYHPALHPHAGSMTGLGLPFGQPQHSGFISSPSPSAASPNHADAASPASSPGSSTGGGLAPPPTSSQATLAAMLAQMPQLAAQHAATQQQHAQLQRDLARYLSAPSPLEQAYASVFPPQQQQHMPQAPPPLYGLPPMHAPAPSASMLAPPLFPATPGTMPPFHHHHHHPHLAPFQQQQQQFAPTPFPDQHLQRTPYTSAYAGQAATPPTPVGRRARSTNLVPPSQEPAGFFGGVPQREHLAPGMSPDDGLDEEVPPPTRAGALQYLTSYGLQQPQYDFGVPLAYRGTPAPEYSEDAGSVASARRPSSPDTPRTPREASSPALPVAPALSASPAGAGTPAPTDRQASMGAYSPVGAPELSPRGAGAYGSGPQATSGSRAALAGAPALPLGRGLVSRSEAGRGSGAAAGGGAMLALGPLESGLLAGRPAGGRRMRRASSNSSPSADGDGGMGLCGGGGPVTADEAVALGSLTGRFRTTLKEFSRKVARSLSFQRGGGLPSPGGSSGSSSAGYVGVQAGAGAWPVTATVAGGSPEQQ